ncbi:hypothetical protein J3F84DRAFT_361458 [Trichoderma pleuroticola]
MALGETSFALAGFLSLLLAWQINRQPWSFPCSTASGTLHRFTFFLCLCGVGCATLQRLFAVELSLDGSRNSS